MSAGPFGTVQLVSGSKMLEVDGSTLRDEAAGFRYVVVDLGAGDGRFVYRLARTHADWFCVAIDANADGLRDRSRRAARKPSRGGAPNVRFVRAAAESLPSALESLADVIYVLYPWGSLLRAVLAADLEVLMGIARVGKPGARVEVRVNASILGGEALSGGLGVPLLTTDAICRRLVPLYREAGIPLTSWRAGPDDLRTTWGRRLGQGVSPNGVALTGTIQRPAHPRGSIRALSTLSARHR